MTLNSIISITSIATSKPILIIVVLLLPTSRSLPRPSIPTPYGTSLYATPIAPPRLSPCNTTHLYLYGRRHLHHNHHFHPHHHGPPRESELRRKEAKRVARGTEERLTNIELWVARRVEESLLIFRGTKEHFRYGFIAHFLSIPPH